jgi:hypothetical protein
VADASTGGVAQEGKIFLLQVWVFIMTLGCLSWIAPATTSAGTDAGAGGVEETASGRSDFNGDGFADLAVRASEAVHVLYGSPAGLTAVGNQLWSQDSPGIEGVTRAGIRTDGFGGSLAAGDFNGDGFGDLAVGVPSESEANHGGAINVIYGSADGLTSAGNQLWSQRSTGVAGTAEDGDEFGASLAAADFGGSAQDDLLVGVPGESVGRVNNAGAVQVLYGSAGGLSTAGNMLWTQNSPGIVSSAEESDRFGSSLTAGDFGKSGYADAAVGSHYEAIGRLDAAGVVHVLFGATTGLTSSGSQLWSQNSRGVPGVAREGELFGLSLVAAGFGGDSHDDLAIGVPFKSSSTKEHSGAVIVLYGSDSGVTSAGSQLWTQNSPGIKGAGEDLDAFGDSLASGDLGKSMHADLVVGVPGEFIGDVGSGAVNVIYGSAAGLTSTGNQLWHPGSPGLQGNLVEAEQTGFGTSVAAGNFGRSGLVDLAIGAPGAQVGEIEEAGVIHAAYGSAAGLTAAGSQLWSRATPGILSGPDDRSEFGSLLFTKP